MMASSQQYLCSPCKELNKSKPAKLYCFECDDLQCKECNIQHGVFKSTRDHPVITIEQYSKLSESVKKISPFCRDHKLKYVHFCTAHDQPCCPKCLTTSHSHCRDIKVIQDVISNAKTSTAIEEIERCSNEIKSNLNKIIKMKQTNILDIKNQKIATKEKIKALRKEVTKHLTFLEEKALAELDQLEKSEISALQKSVTDLTTTLNTTTNIIEEVSLLKQYSSDLQTFIGTREMMKNIEQEKTLSENLSTDGSLNIRELQCSINEQIRAILPDITEFASIHVATKPSNISLTSDKEKQAQLFLPRPRLNAINFDDVKAEIKTKITIENKNTSLRGCSIFPNDKVVIADSGSSCVIILAESGAKEKELPISRGGPWDVTVIDDILIAVSTDKGVQIINVNTGSVEKMFNVGCSIGVSYHGGMLYCCVPNKGVSSIKMSTGRNKTIIRDRHHYWSYCVVTGDNLYYTRSDKNGVQSYSIKGEKKWEYEDTTQINNPLGVTVDGSGNVYLASSGNHQILMISPDGQRCRLILNSNDGINRPWGVYFNEKKNELIIACAAGNCFHLKINHK